MRNIFDEIREKEAVIAGDKRNPHLRYQLGNLYLEFMFSGDSEFVAEYVPKARDEFVYCLSVDRKHIRAWCGLAFAGREILKEGGRKQTSKQYNQEGHDFNLEGFDEIEFSQRMRDWLSEYDKTEQLTSQILLMLGDRVLTADECADVSTVVRPYNESKSFFYIAKAREIDPMNKKVLEHEADILMANCDFKGAVGKYRQAIELNPDNYELRYWFMVALQRAGMKKESGEQSSLRRKMKEERFAEIA